MLKHEQKKVGELEALLRENGVTQMKEEEEERVKRREEEEVVEVERRKCSEEKEQLIKSENSSSELLSLTVFIFFLTSYSGRRYCKIKTRII